MPKEDPDVELEAEDKSDDTELDDVEASFEDGEDDSEESDSDDSSESEDDDAEEADDEDEEDSADEADEDEGEPEKDKPEAKKKQPELTEEEKQKARNKAMAEKRLQDKATREKTIKEEQDAYLSEADPDDTRDLAVRQLQVDAYNNSVERNTSKLQTSFDKAVVDFPILSDKSPEIQQFVSESIDAFQAQHVTIDKYGNPVKVTGDFYAYLQRKADSIAALTGKGARQQAQNKTKQRAKVLASGSRAPKSSKSDPGLDGFDEEAKRW